MALVRWNPRGRTIANSRDELECLLNEFFGPWSPRQQGARTEGFAPRVDLLDRPQEVMLKVDVPGLDKEDLDITVTSNVVTIRGERRNEEASDDECYYCKESYDGSFERQIQLPENVQSEKASAALDKGVLTLTIPKTEPKSSVKIAVN
jgi:HSP20 family protein